MMNVLEQEDIIKGLPDQALMQEAQMPSGQVPQYLVVSEIQRRSDMRKRYKADQGQMPQGTVKDKVVQEGIMASMPPQMPPQMAMAPQMAQRMPNMPPPQMPPQGIEQAMPPQMMSGGGVVRMANGGRTQAIIQQILAKNPNAQMADFLAAGVTQEDVFGFLESQSPMTFDEITAGATQGALPGPPIGRAVSAAGQLVPSGARGVSNRLFGPIPVPSLEKARSGILAGVQGMSSLFGGDEETLGTFNANSENRPPDNMVNSDIDLAGLLTDEDRARNQADIAMQQKGQRIDDGVAMAIRDPFIPTPIDAQVAKGLPLTLSPSERALTEDYQEQIRRNQMPFKDRGIRDIFGDKFVDTLGAPFGGLYDLAGKGVDNMARSSYAQALASIPDLISGDDSAESIEDQNERLGLGPRGPARFLLGEDSMPPVTTDADVTEEGIATTDPARKPATNEAGGINLQGDGKEVQSDSVFSTDDYRSRLDYLMSLGVDSDKEVEIPTLDYSDIRADLDRRTKSNMLFRLAEGIGKGDVASGIGGMSKVAEEAARDISKIDIAERKGQFDAATAAQKRQDNLIKTQRTLGAELIGLSDKLRLDKSVNKRAIINYYAKIREGLQDQLVALSQFETPLPAESAALMKQIDRMLQDLGAEYGVALPDIGGDGTNNPAEISGGSLSLNLPNRTAP